MLFIARELREIMASLGVRSVEELVGRTDLLKVRRICRKQEQRLDLSGILMDMSGRRMRIDLPSGSSL